MIHITCDHCGKKLCHGEDRHFVVKVEVYAVNDSPELTEADLDDDHMEAVSQMLCTMEEKADMDLFPPARQHLRYDLCTACRQRFLRDPLGKESAQKFDFSEN